MRSWVSWWIAAAPASVALIAWWGLSAHYDASPTSRDVPAILKTQVSLSYDDAAHAAVRRTYAAWVAHPQLDLEFDWRPVPGTAGEGPLIGGRGELAWRRAGASVYDRDAVVSLYRGDMREGWPHGRGTLRLRDGTRYEGDFRAGLYHGAGRLRSANGDAYEGAFLAGAYHGSGRLMLADGEVYDGPFVHGLRHGEGRTRLAAGASYSSTWVRGVEDEGSRHIRLAQLGAAAALPSRAAAPPVSIVVDWWADEVLNYAAANAGATIAIRPDDDTFMRAWEGKGSIGTNFLNFQDGGLGYEFWPVPVNVSVKNPHKNRLDVKRVFLEVAESVFDARPLYAIWYKPEHYLEGCTDNFTSKLAFANFGWTSPSELKVEAGFAPAGSHAGAPTVPLAVQSVRPSAKGTYVRDIDADFDEVGLNAEKLPATCGGGDGACLAALVKSGALGTLGPAVSVKRKVAATALVGRLSYEWTDQKGTKHAAQAPFDFAFQIGDYAGRDPPFVSCAEGATPPDFNPGSRTSVRLELDKAAYERPIQAAGSIAPGRSLKLALLLEAPKTSHHRFRVAVETGSGEILRSKEVDLLFIRPPFSPTAWAQKISWEEMKGK